jgi:enoyl-CoA hydratase
MDTGASAPNELTLEALTPQVALLTLKRPHKLNALSWSLVSELHQVLEQISSSREVRVVVLTGDGRGFCSGMDLDGDDAVGTASDMLDTYRRQEQLAGLTTALRKLPQPVIAAVNGPAAGGGMALALACDLRVCSTDARFNVAFVRIGLSGCDMGVSHLLPRLVGLGLASELMLTGRPVDAHEAKEIGLANRVVAPEQLRDSCIELAAMITANSPFGVWMTKQVLARNHDMPSLEAALELENRTQVLATRTTDMKEALAAFAERRPALFRGA